MIDNPVMALDPVSELLRLVRARCTVTGGLRAGGDWSYRSTPQDAIKLDAIIDGSCWIVVDEHPPLHLAAGDAVILNGARKIVLCSDPALASVSRPTSAERGPEFFAQVGSGTDVGVIGGHIEIDPLSADLFASALPPILCARGDSAEAAEIRQLLERIVEESAGARPGASFAAAQHAQLLLVAVLRAGLDRDVVRHSGWLRLLMDPGLRPAVALLHADPARSWSLTELASAAGMSRSHFAHRFCQAAGQPPITYLTHWRIQLARQALRDSRITLAALAEQLGYASESSLTHAFTRVVGVSPSHYRREHLEAQASR